MGRYYSFSDGQEGKFWFACQSTQDICDFGGYDRSEGNVYWGWSKDDLPEINRVLKETNELLEKETTYTYKSFMSRMNKTGYLGSSADQETSTHNYKLASEYCAKINLGLKIRRGVRLNDYLEADAEC